jgi:TonB family protein
MSSCLIKKALPFALTLLVGLALGNIFSNAPRRRAQNGITILRSLDTHARRDGDCAMYRRNRGAGVENFYQTNWTVFLSNPQPRYTQAARVNGIEGDVRLLVTFGANARTTEVQVLDGLPYGLTEEAIKAVKEIRFMPATRNGIPVDETRVMTYSFDLNEQSDD